MGLFVQKFPKITSIPQDYEMMIVKVEPTVGYYLDNTISLGLRDKISF